jgi:glycosyltransferase involved in cell wall biosynthesis
MVIQDKAASLDRPVAATGRLGGRRRVLIHGINYAPELIGVGRYTGDFAEYLAEQGHVVEVVTAVPHYPGWWVRPPFRNYRYWSEIRSGVKIIRCPLLLHRSGKGLWRLLMPLTFALAAARVVFWRILRSRPGTVICIEPTLLSAPAAIVAAKIVGARRALHVHDLEVDAAFAVGHLRTGSLRRLAEAFGRFLIRRFDVIVTLSERMRERLAAKKPRATRIEVIRNWVDTGKIRPLRGPNSFRRELGLSETDFVALYAGQWAPSSPCIWYSRLPSNLWVIPRSILSWPAMGRSRTTFSPVMVTSPMSISFRCSPKKNYANCSTSRICMCCRRTAGLPISSCHQSLAACSQPSGGSSLPRTRARNCIKS